LASSPTGRTIINQRSHTLSAWVLFTDIMSHMTIVSVYFTTVLKMIN
jgi:hypothetical protein